LSTTALTPVAGTPPLPVTGKVNVCPGPSGPGVTGPVPSRVSRIRAGGTGWYWPLTAGNGVGLGEGDGEGEGEGEGVGDGVVAFRIVQVAALPAWPVR